MRVVGTQQQEISLFRIQCDGRPIYVLNLNDDVEGCACLCGFEPREHVPIGKSSASQQDSLKKANGKRKPVS